MEESVRVTRRSARAAVFLAVGSGLALTALLPAVYLALKTRRQVHAVRDVRPGSVETIVVLGAKVRPDGTPSLMLASRLDVGIQMLNAGVAPRLVLSGIGGTEADNEIPAMVKKCLDEGVPLASIEVDEGSRTTEASVAYIAANNSRYGRIVFVSQRYHLPRVLFVAQRLSLNAIAVTAEPKNNVKQVYRSIREWGARARTVYSDLLSGHF